MKYNISKENIKKEQMFTAKLTKELLEETVQERQATFEHFYCNGCNGLLFMEKDVVYHAPVYASSFMVPGNKLKIMEGDTSNVALFN